MGEYEIRTYDSVKVGEKATFSKTVTQVDDALFAGISGDYNPVHIDEEYAKTTQFKTRIVHGAYTVGLISAVIGMKLPGPGCIYGSQTVRFTAPVHFGDTVTAIAEVIEKKEKGKRLIIKTIVLKDYCVFDSGKFPKDTVVAEGEATIFMMK
ncbi:MAG: MaoC family dehydratase [Candidatus Hodarchaeota archaeon]